MWGEFGGFRWSYVLYEKKKNIIIYRVRPIVPFPRTVIQIRTRGEILDLARQDFGLPGSGDRSPTEVSEGGREPAEIEIHPLMRDFYPLEGAIFNLQWKIIGKISRCVRDIMGRKSGEWLNFCSRRVVFAICSCGKWGNSRN